MSIDIREENFEYVELFGRPALFTSARIDRDTVPEGWFAYDLRGSDYDPGEPVSVEPKVIVNHAGTILTYGPVTIPKSGPRPLKGRLDFSGDQYTLAEFCEVRGLNYPKDNRKYILRPASPDEAGIFYAMAPEKDVELGCIGHVRMDFGHSGKEFWHTWQPRGDEALNSPEFKAELSGVVDEFRKTMLKDLASMSSYCSEHGGKLGENSAQYPDAVALLLNGERGKPYPSKSAKPKPPPKSFQLPPANRDMRRVFSYLLNVRGISRDTVAFFSHQHLLYEDVPYHNAVFVGRDADGIARHAHRHSTGNRRPSFQQTEEGSDGHFPFHWVGQSDRLYVFEAPIDLLSFLDQHPNDWQSHSYVACCGTSSLPVLKMLELVPQIQQVFLCMDNDKAGNLASERIMKLLTERCAAAQRLSPIRKDWNEDLIAVQSKSES